RADLGRRPQLGDLHVHLPARARGPGRSGWRAGGAGSFDPRQALISMPSTAPRRAAVITTSWPRHEGDAAGHFVLAEVEELLGSNWAVTVLPPGTSPYEPPRCRVLSLGGDELFAWPGALPRLRQEPGRIVVAAEVVL